jgi:general secretion pathway protein I
MTLIEVLVALVVIGVAMAAVIKTVDTGVLNVAYMKERSFAHWVALNRDTELQLEGASTGTRWQETRMAGRSWHVRTKIEATSDPAILRALIEVFLSRDDDAPRAQLTSYLLRAS